MEQTNENKEIADEIKQITDQIPETAAAATVPLDALDRVIFLSTWDLEDL